MNAQSPQHVGDEAHQRDVAYLRDAVALQQPTLGNLFKAFRHRLNLLLDWSLGSWLPALRRHRFRHATWQWDEPAPGLITRAFDREPFRGTFRDTDGRAPAAIIAEFGLARVSVRIDPKQVKGMHAFDDLVVIPPGFSWVRLTARLDSGVSVPLGHRLLRNSGPLPDPPAPALSLVLSPKVPAPEDIHLGAASAPLVSIVIPVHGQTDYTLRCLASIARFTGGTACEVIVVDDCSPPDSIAPLHEVSDLRLLRNGTNLGFIRSCNAGAGQARGRFLVLLNNDTEVQAGWIDALLSVFRDHPSAGLAGARLVYPDGTLQEAGGICWRDGSAWNYGRNQAPNLPAFTYLHETDYCSGACLMLPMDLWRQLDGFDERYVPAYFEDTDLAFRVRAAGRKVVYQPRAVVVHHEGKSNGTSTRSGVKAHQVRNQRLFFERWKDVLAAHEPNGQRVFRARDRSLDRKVMLVIDHYVPRPDKDAGSRNMMTYLRLFVDAGYAVKFIGDNHHADQPYTDQLAAMGVEVLVGSDFKQHWLDWLRLNGREIDYVFLSRAHTSLRWIEPLRQHTRASLLFYGHDLLSRTLRRAHEQLGDPRHLEESRASDAVERQIFPCVDWIYYPSDIEVRSLRAAWPQARISRLPLFAYDEPERSIPAFQARHGLLFVGGFGHPPNADGVGWFVREIWPSLVRRLPDLELTLVGSTPTDEVRALCQSHDRIRLLSDIDDATLTGLYLSHRVAIVPLRYGGGIKGKILESMHLGTPVVSTTIGAEGLEWVGGGHLLVADDTGFADAVYRLHTDATLWTRLQAEAWRFLAADYSPAALRHALAPALPELRETA